MNIFQLFNLHMGEEKQEIVLENIKKSISFRGANLWILACAIIIASIGLNINSSPVVVGAMLISPLMGPIVGLGYALATYNLEVFKKSLKSLVQATLLSLLVSCIYFFISPFKDAQSEILARTTPNIYDILIAFIGGVVGAIAITRVEKGNSILGVAIATALMPPLCTAGYGIATFNPQFFIGAMYLYVINCFFIALATFVMIKYLKYRPYTSQDEKFDKKVKYALSFLIVLILIPSLFLAYRLLEEKRYDQNVEKFLQNEFTSKGRTILYSKINQKDKPKSIELVLFNQNLDSVEIKDFRRKMENYNLGNTKLIFKQNSSDLKSEILAEIQKQNKDFNDKDLIIQELNTELKAYKENEKNISKEMKILFPEIQKFSIGQVTTHQNDSTYTEETVIYHTEEQVDEQKLVQWLKTQLNTDKIKVIPVK